jgi:hypothetical protein
MNKTITPVQAGKESLLSLWAWIGDLMNWPASIEVVRCDDQQLELAARFRRIVVDKDRETISVNGQIFTKFRPVEAISIAHRRGDRRREWWTVRLNIVGGRSFLIGRSLDDLEASSVAAQLSSFIGKPVVINRDRTQRH